MVGGETVLFDLELNSKTKKTTASRVKLAPLDANVKNGKNKTLNGIAYHVQVILWLCEIWQVVKDMIASKIMDSLLSLVVLVSNVFRSAEFLSQYNCIVWVVILKFIKIIKMKF